MYIKMEQELDIQEDNEYNEYNSNELCLMRDVIEQMPKFHQIGILRILTENNSVTINENKNGIHVNMSDLTPNKLKNIRNYINYVKTQEDTLNDFEKQKETYKNTFFQKDNKDNTTSNK